MEFGLIGEHLGHSFSREIHGMLSSAPYELRELSPSELPGFLKERKFRGVNVTIPYKRAVMEHLDALAPSAELTGAVNTIVNDGGRLIGHNTDFDGFIALARHSGIAFSGARVVILGNGGAAAAVGAAARTMGASFVRHAVRNICSELQLPIDKPDTWDGCDILVNATPVGMYPLWDSVPVDISSLKSLRGVLDCIYNPLRPKLILDARERSIAAEGGLYMLVAQAVRARELFDSGSIPEERTEEVFRHILKGKRNLVLCGMPSSGKSTVGRELAACSGRRFVDTDEIIALQAGMEIQEIFAREGEAGFRRRETAAIESIAAEQGLVIATGGGAVLSERNVQLMRMNGLLCLLQRSPELLTPTSDRPLSRNREAMEALYAKRLPYYRSAAEVTVSNNGPLKATVDELLRYVDQRQ